VVFDLNYTLFSETQKKLFLRSEKLYYMSNRWLLVLSICPVNDNSELWLFYGAIWIRVLQLGVQKATLKISTMRSRDPRGVTRSYFGIK